MTEEEKETYFYDRNEKGSINEDDSYIQPGKRLIDEVFKCLDNQDSRNLMLILKS